MPSYTSLAIPFEQVGKTLRDALIAAESSTSWSDRVASTLMCDHSGGAGTYALVRFRLGWQIRRKFSKQQIFTIYANRAYFGPGATGVENASKQLFGKDANGLSVEESALLAGLLRAPDRYSPYKHPDAALRRRNRVLEAMATSGTITPQAAARAEANPIVTR